MGLRAWTRRKLREHRRKAAAKEHAAAPLREFVYLDEISVYSLIASRLGPIAAEFTETQSESLRGEVTGSAKSGVPGVGGAEVGSAIESQQGSGSQVMRKSIVQATFRELFDFERDSLAIRTGSPNGKPPTGIDFKDLIGLSNQESGWVIDPAFLERGQLIEIEIELEAEGIFRMGAIMTAIFEIVEENPNLLDAGAVAGLLEGVMANRMLDRLLAGLVPIRGAAVDYRHVTSGDRELIVHRSLLRAIEDNDLTVRPLIIVGVAEADLFWRDIRRVLFSRSRYSMLCRLGRDGTHDSWTPVKLVEVLKEVMPDLGSQLQDAGEMLEQRDGASAAGSDDQDRENVMAQALTRYAIDLAAHYQQELSVEQLSEMGLPNARQRQGYATLEQRRIAFGEITDAITARFSLEDVDSLVIAGLRASALIDSGLDLDGILLPFVDTEQNTANPVVPKQRFIDTEIVAIYW